MNWLKEWGPLVIRPNCEIIEVGVAMFTKVQTEKKNKRIKEGGGAHVICRQRKGLIGYVLVSGVYKKGERCRGSVWIKIELSDFKQKSFERAHDMQRKLRDGFDVTRIGVPFEINWKKEDNSTDFGVLWVEINGAQFQLEEGLAVCSGEGRKNLKRREK